MTLVATSSFQRDRENRIRINYEDKRISIIIDKDSSLDQEFFNGFLTGDTRSNWIEVDITFGGTVTLDLTGVTFPSQSYFILSACPASRIVIKSATVTGISKLMLDDNQCYDLDELNGAGIGSIALGVIREKLVINAANFPSLHSVASISSRKDSPLGGDIELLGLELSRLKIKSKCNRYILTNTTVGD